MMDLLAVCWDDVSAVHLHAKSLGVFLGGGGEQHYSPGSAGAARWGVTEALVSCDCD